MKPSQGEKPPFDKLLLRPSVWRKPSGKSGLKTVVLNGEIVTVRTGWLFVPPRGSVNALPAVKTFVLGITCGAVAPSMALCDSAIRICCKINCKSLTVTVKSAPSAAAEAVCVCVMEPEIKIKSETNEQIDFFSRLFMVKG